MIAVIMQNTPPPLLHFYMTCIVIVNILLQRYCVWRWLYYILRFQWYSITSGHCSYKSHWWLWTVHAFNKAIQLGCWGTYEDISCLITQSSVTLLQSIFVILEVVRVYMFLMYALTWRHIFWFGIFRCIQSKFKFSRVELIFNCPVTIG